MAESLSSPPSCARDVSSTMSLYDNSISDTATDNISTRAVYETSIADEDPLFRPVSRPLSRSSINSGLSMIATKDGVEGRRVPRYGIPQYSLNLLNTMNSQNHWKKSHGDDLTRDCLSGPPMTLKEKMRLLTNDRTSRNSSNESTDSFEEQAQNESIMLSSSRNHLFLPRMHSELESNSSTLGDDPSYLYEMGGTQPALSVTDSDREGGFSYIPTSN
ncbi:uncharacterized protein Ecym_8025 [Eremothecium cymbalariae DBVPG|uniref:Uncharacterized protein n=1 Tax=Eremothecium cymbalariae (strain CBS 270.75 / DBVPG 7215 / KCTC 17166 / NRRL Y-17582) TaxID=931890 RepID=G8JWU7_ERECY|nr:Hypothetical protein Ecym_8025 [Eremothecium cymbalariae DBVPG\